MTVRAIFFDVGETLVDEERYWRAVARCGGSRSARRLGCAREDDRAWGGALGAVGPPRHRETDSLGRARVFEGRSLSRCARLPGAREVVRHGRRHCGQPERGAGGVGEVGSAARRPRDGLGEPRGAEARPPVLPTARGAGACRAGGGRLRRRPGRQRLLLPALEAGLVVFHLRRGPWGRLQETPADAIAIDSLAEMPHVSAAGLWWPHERPEDRAWASTLMPSVKACRSFWAVSPSSSARARRTLGRGRARACADRRAAGSGGPCGYRALFPSDDERYRGADSLGLLAEAYRQVREAGFVLVNADCVVIGEEPRLADQRESHARPPGSSALGVGLRAGKRSGDDDRRPRLHGLREGSRPRPSRCYAAAEPGLGERAEPHPSTSSRQTVAGRPLEPGATTVRAPDVEPDVSARGEPAEATPRRGTGGGTSRFSRPRAPATGKRAGRARHHCLRRGQPGTMSAAANGIASSFRHRGHRLIRAAGAERLLALAPDPIGSRARLRENLDELLPS